MSINSPNYADRLDAVLDIVITGLDGISSRLRALRQSDNSAGKSLAALKRAATIDIDISVHNPAWKKGVRLTKLGRRAIAYAYASGLDSEQVSTLFQITPGSAYTYQRRCNGQMPWPRGEEPEGFDPRH